MVWPGAKALAFLGGRGYKFGREQMEHNGRNGIASLGKWGCVSRKQPVSQLKTVSRSSSSEKKLAFKKKSKFYSVQILRD